MSRSLRLDRRLAAIVATIGVLLHAGCVSFKGLRPVAPPVRGFAASPPTLDTLRPRFEWEPLAASELGEEARRQGGEISDVVYDFRLLEGTTSFMKGLQYDVSFLEEGISEPSFELPFDLEPGRIYYWGVRARYQQDGRPRETVWSEFGTWMLTPVGYGASRHNQYFFRTPESPTADDVSR